MHAHMRFQAHALHIYTYLIHLYHIHSMCMFVHVCLYTLGVCLCVYGQLWGYIPLRRQMCTYAYTCRRWGGGSCRWICWRDLVIWKWGVCLCKCICMCMRVYGCGFLYVCRLNVLGCVDWAKSRAGTCMSVCTYMYISSYRYVRCTSTSTYSQQRALSKKTPWRWRVINFFANAFMHTKGFSVSPHAPKWNILTRTCIFFCICIFDGACIFHIVFYRVLCKWYEICEYVSYTHPKLHTSGMGWG
jgi:hypothetical protein